MLWVRFPPEHLTVKFYFGVLRSTTRSVSLKYFKDYVTVDRRRNEIYVWLGNYKKGKTKREEREAS